MGLPLTFVWSGRLGPSTKSRDITWSRGGCQGDAAVFIFQVVRQVIMVYDRDRGGNLRPSGSRCVGEMDCSGRGRNRS